MIPLDAFAIGFLVCFTIGGLFAYGQWLIAPWIGERKAKTRLFPYVVPVDPKQMREALCVAQCAIGNFYPPGHNYHKYSRTLQILIDECDRLRPVKNDGKHDGPSERCGEYCGC